MMENRFNINAKLKRFNLDPVAFRTALGHSGALISGSFALQFLLGTVWKGTDLDVMVEKGTNMEMLGAFLIEQEGFAVIDSIPDMGRCKYGGEVSQPLSGAGCWSPDFHDRLNTFPPFTPLCKFTGNFRLISSPTC